MKILKSKNQTLLLENYPPFDVHSQKKRFFMISHCSILKIQRDIFLLEYPFFYFLLIFYFFTFFLLFNIFLSSAKSRLFLVQTPKKSFPKMNTEKLPNWLLPSMASNVPAQPTLRWVKEVRHSAPSADSMQCPRAESYTSKSCDWAKEKFSSSRKFFWSNVAKAQDLRRTLSNTTHPSRPAGSGRELSHQFSESSMRLALLLCEVLVAWIFFNARKSVRKTNSDSTVGQIFFLVSVIWRIDTVFQMINVGKNIKIAVYLKGYSSFQVIRKLLKIPCV